jgi:hypothetical protein
MGDLILDLRFWIKDLGLRAQSGSFFAEDLFHRMKLTGQDVGIYPLCDLAKACSEMAVGKNFQGG